MAQTMNLTGDQLEALKKGEAVRVFLPESGTDVVLMKVEGFEKLREMAEENLLQRRWLDASHESAVEWMKENPYAASW